LSEKDVKLVLLQHQDGRAALEQRQVDAWAGLDPMMATAEVEGGARLFYRDAEANTWGVLNVREEFADAQPELVRTVIGAYEKGRTWARANPEAFKAVLANAAKLSDPVAKRQLERTDLGDPSIGSKQRASILAAGLALQQAGVIPAEVKVEQVVEQLLDNRFSKTLASN
jgi:sulfonate transport system substrate-binding protein